MTGYEKVAADYYKQYGTDHTIAVWDEIGFVFVRIDSLERPIPLSEYSGKALDETIKLLHSSLETQKLMQNKHK